jgi:peptidoglycan hydrolase-like protein with peptidoglycan-binding domain
MKRLNNSGVAHHFALALLVVGIVAAGAFHAVTSHALTDAGGSASVSTKNTSVSATASISNPSACTARPHPHVTYGMHNSCVAYLQSRIGAGVDGQFGGGTAGRVAAIQRASHLKDVSGRDVGACTWAAIDNINTVPASCKTAGAPTVAKTQAGCTYIGANHKSVTVSGPYTTTSCIAKNYAYCKVTTTGKVTYFYRTKAMCTAKQGAWTGSQTVPQNTAASAGTGIYTASSGRTPGTCKFTASVDHTGKMRSTTTSASAADCAHKSKEVDCKYKVATDTAQLGATAYRWRTPGTGSTECQGLQASGPLLGTCRYYPFGKGGYAEVAVSVTSTQMWCNHRDNGPGNKTRSWVALVPAKRAS